MDGDMDDEMIQYLLSIGALYWAFENDEGEDIYRLTPEARELIPNLYDEHVKDFNGIVFSLWNQNMLNLVFDEEGEPLISLNENSTNEEMISNLDKKEQEAMREIIFVYKMKEE